jgi:hypothetical protein
MIEFPLVVGILGWVSILLFYLLIAMFMKKKEMVYGFLVTGLIDLVAVWSVGGDEIIKWGFILGICIIFAFSCGIRLMIASAGKESITGGDAPTDWVSFGWYSLGAAIATLLTSVIVLF